MRLLIRFHCLYLSGFRQPFWGSWIPNSELKSLGLNLDPREGRIKMKGIFIVGVLVVTQLSLAHGLKCYKCKYVLDKEGEECEKDYGNENYEVTCDAAGAGNAGPNFYCVKWIDLVNEDDMTTIVRDCYGTNETLNEELEEDCNQGEDYIYNSTYHHAGLLCYCKDDLCNSGVMTGLHLALTAIGFLSFKLIQ